MTEIGTAAAMYKAGYRNLRYTIRGDWLGVRTAEDRLDIYENMGTVQRGPYKGQVRYAYRTMVYKAEDVRRPDMRDFVDYCLSGEATWKVCNE